MELRVLGLYPDQMNIYADRGNIIFLRRRCEWRGIGFVYDGAGQGESVDRHPLKPLRAMALISCPQIGVTFQDRVFHPWAENLRESGRDGCQIATRDLDQRLPRDRMPAGRLAVVRGDELCRRAVVQVQPRRRR